MLRIPAWCDSTRAFLACCFAALLCVPLLTYARKNSDVTVKSSQQLASALKETSVDRIAIAGTLSVDPRHFRTAAIIARNRNVVLTSAVGAPGILDFRGTADVAYLTAQSSLKAQGITVQGLAAPDVHSGLPIDMSSAALWPSVRGAPGSKFEAADASIQFPLPDGMPSCPVFTSRMLDQLSKVPPEAGHTGGISLQGDILHVSSRFDTKAPLSSFDVTVGHIDLALTNSTLQCLAPSGSISDSSLLVDLKSNASVWLTQLVAVAASIACAVLWLDLKRSKLQAGKNFGEAKLLQAQARQSNTAMPLSLRKGCKTGLTMPKMPSSGSSDSINRFAGRTSANAGDTIAPTYVDTSWGRATDLGADPLWDSLRTRSTGPSEGADTVQPLADHHGYLLRMRMEGGLEGIELGPLLGRGSYGRVYKGRWKGALVAIKIVEHSGVGNEDMIEGARESLLAASVSHPNIVACYKICTVSITRRRPSCDAEGFPVPSPSGHSMERTVSLVTVDTVVKGSSPRPGERASIEANVSSAAQTEAAPKEEMSELNQARMKVVSDVKPSLTKLNQIHAAHSGYLGGLPSELPQRKEADAATVQKPSESSHQDGAQTSECQDEPQAQPTAAAPTARTSIGSGDSETPAAPLEMTTADLDTQQIKRSHSQHSPDADSVMGGSAFSVASTHVSPVSHRSSVDRGTIETWMLLEYADRGSLEEAIEQHRFHRKALQGRPDLVSVYRTLLDVVSGMQYLHGLGLVHGDLKPANCLLKSTVTDSRGFNVKLTDFGLSRMLDMDKSHVSTKSFGTIPYMSPELLSLGRMSRANDVYSFGILMWQLFTGKTPYEGMTPMQVLFNVVDCSLRPDVPAECPPRYKRLFTSCWHDWPQNRPTFDDISAEITAMLAEERRCRQKATFRSPSNPSNNKDQGLLPKKTQPSPQRQARPQQLRRSSAESAGRPQLPLSQTALRNQQRSAAMAPYKEGSTRPSRPHSTSGRQSADQGHVQPSLQGRLSSSGAMHRARSISPAMADTYNNLDDLQSRAQASTPEHQVLSERAAAARIFEAGPKLSISSSQALPDPTGPDQMKMPIRQGIARQSEEHNGTNDGSSQVSYNSQLDDVMTPPPARAREDNTRFMRLVQQSQSEGGPLRYSIELRSRAKQMDSSILVALRRSADFGREAIRRKSLECLRSSSDNGALSIGGLSGAHRSLTSQHQRGAPPASASSGVAGVFNSPFAHKRSWQLNENLVASGLHNYTDASETLANSRQNSGLETLLSQQDRGSTRTVSISETVEEPE